MPASDRVGLFIHAGCWTARANENANAQGSRDLNLTFMASNRAEANSPDWPHALFGKKRLADAPCAH
jgi:hypothetical protein